jgi:peptidyl-prolyl cis-trans isomerase C
MAQRAPIIVNGVALAPQAVAEEAQHHPAKTPAKAFEAAGRALVIRHLLLEEAERCAIAAESMLVAPGKRETSDEARIRNLIAANVAVDEPDEAECRAFYDTDPARFRSPDLFEASHILLAAHPHDSEAFAKAVAQAQDLIAELTRAPRRFEALAREHSACDSRANGGRLGQIAPGETVPEFEAVLYALEEGRIAPEPVQSRFGAHVLRLDARARGETLPFEYVRDRIAAYLTERAWRRNVVRYIDGLVAQAEIEGLAMARPQEVAA